MAFIDLTSPSSFITFLLGLFVGVPIVVVAIIYLVMPICRLVAWIIGQSVKFIIATIADLARLVGTVLTMFVMAPLAGGNVLFGRWSAAQHYGRAISSEGRALVGCVYRLCVGHPARLFGLKGLVEGIEQRVPQAVAAAPPATAAVGSPRHFEPEPPAIIDQVRAASKSSLARIGNFPGYRVIGTLAGGGSGGKLYIAQPETPKLAALARQGFHNVGDVVIKSFSVATGSSLPQIVRESRALEAARKLGLVLEHDLTPDRFFYVMRYVPGESLGLIAQRLHASAGPDGLKGQSLAQVLSYTSDLLTTLSTYHNAGLWHKDVKPDNIIVSAGRAHLVDFGLITPLRSGMTLTTHGTEYFRDPEMVRLALKGVKVHEVDGCRFDIYAAGAVLFSALENSFPAHGGLSQISRPCPESVRWIVRRAMTDYDKRYTSAAEMLADLRVVMAAAASPAGADSVRPFDLPSVRANGGEFDTPEAAPAAGFANAGPSVLPPPMPALFPTPVAFSAAPAGAPKSPSPSRPAHEQLKSARARAADARKRVQDRMKKLPRASRGVNVGVFMGLLGCAVLFVGLITGVSAMFSVGEAQIVPSPADVIPSVRVELTTGAQVGLPATPSSRTPQSPSRATSKKKSRDNAPVPAVQSADGAGVLLVCDAPLNESIRNAADRLRKSGFTPAAVGLDEGTDQNAPEAIRNVEVSASLRNAVGVLPVPGDEARSAISRWMERNPTFKAVVWVKRGETGDGAYSSWVVADAALPAGQPGLIGAAFAAGK